MKKRLVLALIILFVTAVVALFVGNGAISTADIFSVFTGTGNKNSRVIVFQVRFPRILAATGSGAALSVSGAVLQESLDNRIASPGILGINNGAGLFVLISAILFPFQAGMKCLMAFLGALCVTFFVSALSVKTGMSKTSVVLSGVAVSALCVSVIDLIISLKPETVADKVAFQIGGFATVRSGTVLIAIPVIVIAIVVALITAPSLDVLGLGDETAHGLGLNVKAFRLLSVSVAALLAGASICMGGLLGFVGLIVPNVVRMICPGKSRDKILLSAFYGAIFLLICDTLSRLVVFPYELPCGLLLSVIGAPFLIWILIKKRKRLGAE